MVPLRRGQRRGQPVEVPLVDDSLAALLAGLERRNGVLDLGYELVADLRVGQHVVGGDADLAGVDQLGPGDPLGRDVDVGILGDDDRALAAEFEGHGRQVRGGALVHLATDIGTAGEQHPIEALGDQLLAHRTVAFDHRDRVGIQIARHQLGHQRRRCGCDFGRLEDDGVPGGDGADGWPEGQCEREVPGADDEHRAVGLVLHPAPARQLRELQQPVLAARPPLDVLGGVVGFARRAGDVGQPGFERFAAEVGGQRFGDGGFIVHHQLLQGFQLLLTPLDAARAAGGESLAQSGDGAGYAGCDRCGHCGRVLMNRIGGHGGGPS